jgi:hypothetical protein
MKHHKDDPLGPEPKSDGGLPVLKKDLRELRSEIKAEFNLKDIHTIVLIAVTVIGALFGGYWALEAKNAKNNEDTVKKVDKSLEVVNQKHDGFVLESRQRFDYQDKRFDKLDRSNELIMDKMRVPDIVRPLTPEKPLPPPAPPLPVAPSK